MTHSIETELAIIQERLREIEKLELDLATLRTTYHADRLEIQNLLRLISSLKNILAILATTIVGAIATTFISRYK